MAEGDAKPEAPASSHLDLSKIGKGTKLSIGFGTLGGILVGLYFGHGWLAGHLDLKFMSEAQAADLAEQVTKATEAANNAAAVASMASDRLTLYIESQQLREQREQLAQLEDQLSETLLWESENGENEVSRGRKTDLRQRIEQRRRYIACLERDRVSEVCEL